MPKKCPNPSRNEFLGEYDCPCGYRFLAKGGNSEGVVKLAMRLHAKKCQISATTSTTTQIIEQFTEAGNILVNASHQ